MSNYYELLHLQPTASDAEIQLAFDEQYEQWRRLVTHHDPEIVIKANQAIQLLEKIRATLTDSAKRTVYDEAIGVTAGLIDPTQTLNVPRGAMTPPPPRPGGSKPTIQDTSTSKLWTCQNCGEKNPEHTQFCYNCRTQLVRECPKCHKNTSLVATGNCGNCGANYKETLKRTELRNQLAAELRLLTNQQSGFLNDAKDLLNQADQVPIPSGGNSLLDMVAAFSLMLGVGLVCLGFFSSILVALLGLVGISFGFVYFYVDISKRKTLARTQDTQALFLEQQAAEKQSQAAALETPIMKLREQLNALAD